MKKFIVIISFFCCVFQTTWGQDIHLSQFTETPILRNPALMGIFTGDIRLQAVYRNQWNSVTIPYQTGTLSGEVKYPVGKNNDYVTAGMQLTYDKAGTSSLQAVQVLPAVNYHKSLSADFTRYLSVAFMAGIVQRQFDPLALTFDNQYTNGRYDPTMPTGEEGSWKVAGYQYFDVGFGISYNSTFGENANYYLGLAYYHFNRPKVSFYDNASVTLAPKITFNAGVSVPMGERSKLIAHYNQLHQGSYQEFMGGLMIGYSLFEDGYSSDHGFYGGVFYRYNDAVVPMVRLDMGVYEIGLSYDVNVSKLVAASHSMGGFEISLVYKDFFKKRSSTYNSTACPRF
ncbi:hypothetical protein COR50_09300 [Chitinophaga caeni]|uniref:Type IX secretion system membrane protein PorP/SprF n=1 Tax=Chitinophaga caeni TaxID=2029983 RepID=A0A291QTJ6_9BACT|nr:PorP/SprF family type IX secretion system membrane protein [Chitinophaga caeni]ATL47349.1 hypothetical protein COR50_09300 [Chitinophaga caeni]